MRRLKKLLTLPLRDVLLLGQVAGLLVVVDLGLRLLRLQTLQILLARGWPRQLISMAAEDQRFDRLAWAVEAAGRYMAGTCLKKALVLQWLLSRRGISTCLWLGVQRQGARLQAHAWLESQGMVIGGEPIGERCIPLHCLNGARWGQTL